MSQPFTTTLPFGECSEWRERAVVIPMRRSLVDELRVFVQLLAAIPSRRPMVLDSSSGRLHPDLLAAVVVGLLPRRLQPPVIMTSDMWHRDAGLMGRIEALLVRIADRAIVRYVVQSSEELTVFPETWGLDPQKVRVCTYFYSIPPADAPDAHEAAPVEDLPDDYIFAGGNAHRDYDTLLEVAQALPERQFVIATQRLNGHAVLPPNVIARPVPHAEFVTLLHNARAVVVPMNQDLTRAVGQQTYLNAMVAGKPTIVSQAYGVKDHIEHCRTGLIVDGSVQGYVDALQWVYDPDNAAEVAAMSAEARTTVLENFTFSRYERCILKIIDETLAEHR